MSEQVKVNKSYKGRDISYQNFSGQDLSEQNFSQSCAAYADFSHCDLKLTNFTGADLHGANFCQSTNLSYNKVRLANLEHAELPPGLQFPLLDKVISDSKELLRIYITTTLLCLYSWLTIGSITDKDLLLNEKTVFFPLIQMSLPTGGFYYVAPLLLFILSLVLNFQIAALWRKLNRLPAVFVDGSTLAHHINVPVLSNLIELYLPYQDQGGQTRGAQHINRYLSLVVLFGLAPLTLTLYWWFYLRLHEVIGSTIQVTFLAVLLLQLSVLLRFLRRFQTEPQMKIVSSKILIPWLIILALMCGLSFANARVTLPAIVNQDINLEGVSLQTGGVDGDNLSHVDLTGLNLNGANFKRADLSGVYLSDSLLNRVDLREAILEEALLDSIVMKQGWAQLGNWQGAHGESLVISYTDMSEVNLGFASLPASTISHGSMKKAILEQVNLERAFIDDVRLDFSKGLKASFYMAKLNDVTFNNSNLLSSNFYLSEINGGNFWNANLGSSNFSLAKINDSDFSQTTLHFGQFDNTTATQVSFAEARLSDADFYTSKLTQVNFAKADLTRANFRHAQLRAVDFTNANLHRADFRDAWLDDIRFDGANLRGALFCAIPEAVEDMLSEKQLSEMAIDCTGSELND